VAASSGIGGISASPSQHKGLSGSRSENIRSGRYHQRCFVQTLQVTASHRCLSQKISYSSLVAVFRLCGCDDLQESGQAPTDDLVVPYSWRRRDDSEPGKKRTGESWGFFDTLWRGFQRSPSCPLVTFFFVCLGERERPRAGVAPQGPRRRLAAGAGGDTRAGRGAAPPPAWRRPRPAGREPPDELFRSVIQTRRNFQYVSESCFDKLSSLRVVPGDHRKSFQSISSGDSMAVS